MYVLYTPITKTSQSAISNTFLVPYGHRANALSILRLCFTKYVDATDNRGVFMKQNKVKKQGGTARKNLSAPDI